MSKSRTPVVVQAGRSDRDDGGNRRPLFRCGGRASGYSSHCGKVGRFRRRLSLETNKRRTIVAALENSRRGTCVIWVEIQYPWRESVKRSVKTVRPRSFAAKHQGTKATHRRISFWDSRFARTARRTRKAPVSVAAGQQRTDRTLSSRLPLDPDCRAR